MRSAIRGLDARLRPGGNPAVVRAKLGAAARLDEGQRGERAGGQRAELPARDSSPVIVLSHRHSFISRRICDHRRNGRTFVPPFIMTDLRLAPEETRSRID